MSDLLNYFYMQEKVQAASNRYSHAGVALENAQMRARLAELKSQHEPLAALIDKPLGERERLYAAAFYVVMGRMPHADES